MVPQSRENSCRTLEDEQLKLGARDSDPQRWCPYRLMGWNMAALDLEVALMSRHVPTTANSLYKALI
jgi:hypothetical protein